MSLPLVRFYFFDCTALRDGARRSTFPGHEVVNSAIATAEMIVGGVGGSARAMASGLPPDGGRGRPVTPRRTSDPRETPSASHILPSCTLENAHRARQAGARGRWRFLFLLLRVALVDGKACRTFPTTMAQDTMEFKRRFYRSRGRAPPGENAIAAAGGGAADAGDRPGRGRRRRGIAQTGPLVDEIDRPGRGPRASPCRRTSGAIGQHRDRCPEGGERE